VSAVQAEAGEAHQVDILHRMLEWFERHLEE